jgi:uncharacterized membrane protein YphA (DoxX/SURF4 family)
MNGEISVWERRLRSTVLVISRIALAYLFFTQLWWKMPPMFGCSADFAFTTENAEGRLVRTQGLCDWLGVEAVWAERPRPFFVANLDNQGAPEIAVDLSWAARANGQFITGFVQPNIRWFGWIVWLSEAWIFLSLLLGLFSRLGALVALGVSGQLMIGLAGISSPYEWEWSYIQMVVLSLLLFAFAPGRVFGIDAWLRPGLATAAATGNWLARVLLWLT